MRNKPSVVLPKDDLDTNAAVWHHRALTTVSPDRLVQGLHFFWKGVALAALLVVTGCGNTSPNGSATSGTTQTPSRSFFVAMDRPLRPAEVNVKLFKQHASWLSADGKLVHVSVILVNRGDVTLSSQGKFPVTVVARLVGPTGKVVNDQLAVAHLPNPLPPDNSEAIEVNIPAATLAGHRVALLPMQKDVGRFDKWSTKVLSLGPFVACDPPGPREDTLCVDSGDPLLQIADEPSIVDDE